MFPRTPAPPLLRLSVLLLVALGLRLLALDIQPLWWDEGYSLFFATESPGRLLALTSYDIHPPLYYLLLQGWMALLGIGSYQARLLSVFLGVAALPLAWWVARRLLGRHVAWLTMLLLALAPLHIYYSQEVRMYGLMTLLAAAAAAAWLRRRWVALGGAVLAGLLTHYYFAFFALALALLLFAEWRRGQVSGRGPLRALLIAALGFLPWLLYAAPRLLSYVGGKLQVEGDRPMSALEFLPRHLVAWSLGHPTAGWGWLAWGSALFALLALGALLPAREGRNPRRATPPHPELLLLWLLPTLGIFGVGLRAPFVDARIERQLLAVLPFFLMLVAAGLVRLWRRWSLVGVLPPLAALVALSGTALWPLYTVPRYPNEDYRPLLAEVGARQAPGDGWLAIYPWQVGFLRAYLPRAHPTPIEADLSWDAEPGVRDTALQALLDAHPRLWFPAYQVKGRLLEEELAATLAAQGLEAWDGWVGNTRLYLVGRGGTQAALHALGDFEGVGRVEAALGGGAASSGSGIVPLFVALPDAAAGLRASAQLVGRGVVWGERDWALTPGLNRRGLVVDAGTPPGDYQVLLTLYREGEGQPLARLVEGAQQSPEATVGTLRVERPPVPLPAAALRLAATEPRDISLGAALRLVGVALPDKRWLQGDEVPVTLLWQSEAPLVGEWLTFVQAIGDDGQVRAAQEGAPVLGTFPTSQWQPGDAVRDPHRLPLPADMPPGRYRLIAGLFNPASGARLQGPQGTDQIELGTLQVEARERLLSEPALGEPRALPVGERAMLARVALPAARPVAPFNVTLLWQAQATGGPPLRAFVQGFCDGVQQAVSDHPTEPPAAAWLQGEWIVDSHRLPALPADAQQCTLIAGLYDPASGQRLATAEGDSVTLIRWER